jgi:hypothetical protein
MLSFSPFWLWLLLSGGKFFCDGFLPSSPRWLKCNSRESLVSSRKSLLFSSLSSSTVPPSRIPSRIPSPSSSNVSSPWTRSRSYGNTSFAVRSSSGLAIPSKLPPPLTFPRKLSFQPDYKFVERIRRPNSVLLVDANNIRGFTKFSLPIHQLCHDLLSLQINFEIADLIIIYIDHALQKQAFPLFKDTLYPLSSLSSTGSFASSLIVPTMPRNLSTLSALSSPLNQNCVLAFTGYNATSADLIVRDFEWLSKVFGDELFNDSQRSISLMTENIEITLKLWKLYKPFRRIPSLKFLEKMYHFPKSVFFPKKFAKQKEIFLPSFQKDLLAFRHLLGIYGQMTYYENELKLCPKYYNQYAKKKKVAFLERINEIKNELQISLDDTNRTEAITALMEKGKGLLHYVNEQRGTFPIIEKTWERTIIAEELRRNMAKLEELRSNVSSSSVNESLPISASSNITTDNDNSLKLQFLTYYNN